jgi:hypothetical protein
MTFELAQGRTQTNLFLGTEHPSIEIPEPENSLSLMRIDIFDSGCELVQRKTGQVDRARRFGPPDRRGNEHCQRLVDRL